MKIFVFGLGSIGSNLLVQLAKVYDHIEFYGIDFDSVEERNIGPQAYFTEHVNMLKVQAMHSVLLRYNQKINFSAINKKIESTDDINSFDLSEKDLIIDCFDTALSRNHFSKVKSLPILHVGFSPFFTGEINWHDNYSAKEEVDPHEGDICSKDEAIPFINLMVSIAALTVMKFISKDFKENYIITEKMKIKSIA